MEVKISVYASMGEELLVNMSFLEYMNSLSATLESAVDLLEAMLIIKTHYGNHSLSVSLPHKSGRCRNAQSGAPSCCMDRPSSAHWHLGINMEEMWST